MTRRVRIRKSHVAARAVDVSALFPFVRAVQVDVKFLPSAEGVALGETYYQLRAVSAVDFVAVVCLYVEVVWLAERACKVYVQCVAASRGIARSERELRRTEQPRAVDFVGRLDVLVVVEQLPGAQLQVGQYDSRADRGRLPLNLRRNSGG